MNNGGEVDLVPLPLKLPLPSMSKNGPSAFYQGPQVERGPFGARRPFLAPMGVTNVALGKPVTSSRNIPIVGRLAQITDGNKDDEEEQVVVLSKGPQWVQVDLGAGT